MVKRVGNLWKDVISSSNIRLAYANARRGKTRRQEVRKIDEDPEFYLLQIQKMLEDKTFHSSEYRMFKITDGGKVRDVADLPFFPDRIIHWALMQVVEPVIVMNLISHTYAALPDRGSHKALHSVKKAVHNPDAKYCFKMDVKKYFPSIDKNILMSKLSRRIKDKEIMWLFKKIIFEYPYPGLPIGNYTSQYLANFYLSDIDHYMKEKYHCKYYWRYMDDIIIVGWSKMWLHRVQKKMVSLLNKDKLTIKSNWQIFPIASRGIDFVGYRTFNDFCLIRNRTKQRLKRASDRLIAKLLSGEGLDCHDMGTVSSYRGCLMHCDSYRLFRKTIYKLDMVSS